MRSGMAYVREITQFYQPLTRLSTDGMNHPVRTKPYNGTLCTIRTDVVLTEFLKLI